MPKPTFFNLPPEKREKIIDAAVEEFAQNGLENASTNRIVENSGISKGSFYRTSRTSRMCSCICCLCSKRRRWDTSGINIPRVPTWIHSNTSAG
ncbi:TetR/AcrR family transcriptional regulator [bacterium]|nr:TetR/AcrR family transcriptional regulator [bacterium]